MTCAFIAGTCLAVAGTGNRIPTLERQVPSAFTEEMDKTVTVTFGPLDLPTPHSHHSSGIFTVPRDMTLGGFKAEIFTKEGTAREKPLPRQYLHHITVLSFDRQKDFCHGAPYLVAGTGVEMTEARFPKGYGVKLKKGERLLALVSFYQNVPPTKDVIARFTMELLSKDLLVQELEPYHVSVTVNCYSTSSSMAKDETDEGVALTPGLQIRSKTVKFPKETCVKAAYPHGHDYLALMTLDNQTAGRTLLRTLPSSSLKGLLQGFPPHQIYENLQGFSVNSQDEYQMTMVYYRPLGDSGPRFGMASYLLYMTDGPCVSAPASITPQ